MLEAAGERAAGDRRYRQIQEGGGVGQRIRIRPPSGCVSATLGQVLLEAPPAPVATCRWHCPSLLFPAADRAPGAAIDAGQVLVDQLLAGGAGSCCR